MIKLTKLPAPAKLVDNQEQWTEELLAAIDSGDNDLINSRKKRYNQPEIKAVLKKETQEKCAYCDAIVTTVSHGDIEHITPKSLKPEQTFVWENLTFACQICNQKKSAWTDVIDPYVDDPNEHLFFGGGSIGSLTEKGAGTILRLDLCRASLIGRRQDQYDRFFRIAEQIAMSDDPEKKQLLYQNAMDNLSTGKPEFVATCMAALRLHKPKNEP